jgi:hypothetical protein
MSNSIRYDYGYIHPDREEDLLLTPSTAEINRFLPLIDEYVNSWKNFVDILRLKDKYEKYISSGDQVHDIHFISFTDQNILSQFKQTANLFFSVELNELPQSRYESKVEFVHVYLENVISNAPAVTLIVEHSGRYRAKLRPKGEIEEEVLQPHRATALSAEDDSDNFGGSASGNSPIDLSFWGRGVITSWNIYIEKDEITRKQVDLSQLSKIEIEIGYKSFLAPLVPETVAETVAPVIEETTTTTAKKSSTRKKKSAAAAATATKKKASRKKKEKRER